MLVSAAMLALTGALSPLVASAQNAPSGATTAVGGVEAQTPQVSGAEAQAPRLSGVQAQAPQVAGVQAQAGPVEVQAVQARPIVLPNTGGGPAGDDRAGLLALFGLAALVAGAYLRWRASRNRLGA